MMMMKKKNKIKWILNNINLIKMRMNMMKKMKKKMKKKKMKMKMKLLYKIKKKMNNHKSYKEINKNI